MYKLEGSQKSVLKSSEEREKYLDIMGMFIFLIFFYEVREITTQSWTAPIIHSEEKMWENSNLKRKQ